MALVISFIGYQRLLKRTRAISEPSLSMASNISSSLSQNSISLGAILMTASLLVFTLLAVSLVPHLTDVYIYLLLFGSACTITVSLHVPTLLSSYSLLPLRSTYLHTWFPPTLTNISCSISLTCVRLDHSSSNSPWDQNCDSGLEK